MDIEVVAEQVDLLAEVFPKHDEGMVGGSGVVEVTSGRLCG